MNAIRRNRKLVVIVSTLVVASALIGAVRYSPAPNSEANLAPVAAVQSQPMVGVATGEFVNGLAVYRLPSVSVTVSRSEVLAQIAREDALAQK